MSDTTQDKTAGGLLKNKALILLVSAFAVLIAVGIATS